MKVIRDIKYFIQEIYNNRYVIYELAKRNFLAKNKATYLGLFWVYLQPTLFILILWFVFSFGLRIQPGGDIPFILYLVSGIIAWLFFAENLNALTNVVRQHSFLVKKGNYTLGILPIVNILSSLIPHLVLIIIALIIGYFKGYRPSIYTFQVTYYIVAMMFFLLGLGWITSSTSIFVKDVSNVVVVLTQFGFWLTPIFWNLSIIPENFQWILKLNPMWYIVSGYRDSIIYKIPFWSKPLETLYFWCVTLFLVFIGSIIFRKLKPHFAEVM